MMRIDARSAVVRVKRPGKIALLLQYQPEVISCIRGLRKQPDGLFQVHDRVGGMAGCGQRNSESLTCEAISAIKTNRLPKMLDGIASPMRRNQRVPEVVMRRCY